MCLIVKIDNKYEGNVLFGKGWKEYFVDVLNGRGTTNIEVRSLLGKRYRDVIKEESIFRNLVELALTNTISRIRYNSHENIIIERINLFKDIVKSHLLNPIRNLFMKSVEKSEDMEELDLNWQIKVANDTFLMKSNSSFHSAAIEFHK